MSSEYSFLCGYSYAWQAGYKPKAFTRLEKLLVQEKTDADSSFAKELVIKNRILTEQLQDSYGKLGFLFLSRDYIRKVNRKHPLDHIYVSYHLYNFMYDCKAFLDALAVILNDFYSIAERRGKIDLKLETFRNKLIEKDASLTKVIKKYESWFSTVAIWRDNLIHRFSTNISPVIFTDHPLNEVTKEELDNCHTPCMMLQEPKPLLTGGIKELEKKYGKGKIFREIDPFCQEWINNACDLYDQICNAIAHSLDPDFN